MSGKRSPLRRLRDRLPSRNQSREGKASSISQNSVHQPQSTLHPDSAIVIPKSSQGRDSASTQTQRSLWNRAFEQLRNEEPELTMRFNQCLEIDDGGADSGTFLTRVLKERQTQALGNIQTIQASKTFEGTSSKIRKYFEKAVTVIISCNDFVSAAASTNPYAALAWTGVSVVLPLLLSPTHENEAAINGVDLIVHLLRVYRWQDKIYLSDDHTSTDYKELTVGLYTSILRYEATLLVHLRNGSLKRWANNVFSAGDWSDLTKQIQQKDTNCRDVAKAIANHRTKEWREEERTWRDELLQWPRQEKEQSHLQMLYSNYEMGKNVNPERIGGTCEWFLGHSDFLSWRESRMSNLLWLSADPGCGKSVLAKYLVDRRGEVLTVHHETPTICYFFFKEGDVERVDAAKATCAILHQLFMQRPTLYRHAKGDFENKNDRFLADFEALWNILRSAAEDPSAGEIICVLDALDECHEASRQALIASLVQLYGNTASLATGKPILKFLVTSRPEFDIVRDFRGLTKVRLRGEEESEQISREIDLVIRHRVEELGMKMDLSTSEKSNLLEKLVGIPNQTYLWLHLTFDDIAKRLEFTNDDIAAIANTLPRKYEEAYTNILNRSQNKARARRLLHIILAAITPLTLQEINVAMVIQEHSQKYANLDLWKPEASADKIKNMCGLFVTVVDSNVYLVHQTARDFLLHNEPDRRSTQTVSDLDWKHTFGLSQSNLILAKMCVWYLRLREFKEIDIVSRLEELDGNQHTVSAALERQYVFLSYAACHWDTHLKQSQDLPDAALIDIVASETCNALCPSFGVWSTVYAVLRDIRSYSFPQGATNLIIASYLTLGAVVELLLKRQDVQINALDAGGRSSLWWASFCGHETVAKLLLQREDLETSSPDDDGQSRLFAATEIGLEAVKRLLMQRTDGQTNLQDDNGQSPLSIAIWWGHESVVRLLLQREDVQANLLTKRGKSSLFYAAEVGNKRIIEMLLQREEIEVNLQDVFGRSPLFFAAETGHRSAVELFLQREDILVNLQDDEGGTSLHEAAYAGNIAVVELLLQRDDVYVNLQDKKGRSPLRFAAMNGQAAVVKMLLERGADPNLQDEDGGTPLSEALSWSGLSSRSDGPYEATVRFLRQYGAKESSEIAKAAADRPTPENQTPADSTSSSSSSELSIKS